MAEALSPMLPGRIEDLAQQVLREACERGLMLATAESCTGGLLASLLTDVPGCSHAFERGFVTYSNDAKTELLGVPADLIERETPVAEAVARAMAEGAVVRSGADIAVSITGWTEDGPERGQQGGLVWFACASENRPTVARRADIRPVGRGPVRVACLQIGLEMLLAAMT